MGLLHLLEQIFCLKGLQLNIVDNSIHTRLLCIPNFSLVATNFTMHLDMSKKFEFVKLRKIRFFIFEGS